MVGEKPRIIQFESAHLQSVLDLSIRAWGPVFPHMAAEIPLFVYNAFYPDGWEVRQRKDVEAMCVHDKATHVWVAMLADQVAGFVGLRVHAEDRMGEVHIIAVDPAFQRRGVGRALLDFSFDWFREQLLSMVMVETGGDTGHAPSRATYEAAGFLRYPVARYFRQL